MGLLKAPSQCSHSTIPRVEIEGGGGRTDPPKRSSLEAGFLGILMCNGHVGKSLGLDLSPHQEALWAAEACNLSPHTPP